MTDLRNNLNGGHHFAEASLQDNLLNRSVLLWAILASATYATILWRSQIVGWHTRDAIQLLFVMSGITVAFFRRRLSTRQKSGFLIAVNFVLAVTSLYTIGLLAGGMWCFSLSAVIVSAYHSRRTVISVVALSITAFILIALGFTTGRLHMAADAAFLAYNTAHWLTYLFCFSFSLAILCDTLVTYRRSVQQLLRDMQERNEELAAKNRSLEEATSNVKLLQGMLPICSSCKKIRDDSGYWEQLEAYISRHSEASFSHALCPDCAGKLYPNYYDKFSEEEKG